MKKKILLIISVFVLIIIFIVFTINLNRNDSSFESNQKKIDDNVEIKSFDEESENVGSIEINEHDNNINNIMTITLDNDDFSNTGNKTTLAPADSHYKISNINNKKTAKHSVITGNIKNNTGQNDIVISVEYYDENQMKVGANSINIQGLAIGQTKSFEIRTLKNISTDNYKLHVSYKN